MESKIAVRVTDENIGAAKTQFFQKPPINLSVWQRLYLRLFGETFVGYTSELVSQYLIKCQKHGLFYATRSSYTGKTNCVECLKKELKSHNLI
jgi:hypothetical protein